MANGSNGLMGIRGKVRDLVFREMKYGTTVSSFNSSTYKNKKWTAKQSLARAKFAGLCKLAQVLREANDLGFRSEMSYMSQPCFVRHNYSVLEIKDNGEFRVDYERISVSHGTLALLNEEEWNVENGKIVMKWRWEKGSVGNGGDRVAVMLYCPDCKDDGRNIVMGDGALSQSVVYRKDCRLDFELPKRWAGMQVYGYAFTFDEGGKSSDSQFMRSIKAEVLTVERKFEVKTEEIINVDFEGVEQRNEIIDGRIKRCFVIKFRDDDELIEEILVEPTDDEDFVSEVVNGIRQPSRAEIVTLRMRELIRKVNPKMFEEKYRRREEFRAESWDELCEMVTQAVNNRQ